MDNSVKRLEKKLYSFFSQLINQDLTNSATKYISIEKIEISPDKSLCKIYLNYQTSQKSLQALENSKPYLKKQLAQIWTYKRIPNLVFEVDQNQQKVESVIDILDKLKKD